MGYIRALAACTQADKRFNLSEVITIRLSCSIDAKIAIIFDELIALKYSVILRFERGKKFILISLLNDTVNTYVFWNTRQFLVIWAWSRKFF